MMKHSNASIQSKIEKAIDSVRPYLVADGGDVELVEVSEDLRVTVRLVGACHGCPFSMQTLRVGIEQSIRNEVPDLKELISV